MQYKMWLRSIFTYLSIVVLLSSCVSLSLVSPSFNYTNNYSEDNPNQITCDVGNFYSYPTCSIPISRFIVITAKYADPLPGNAMLQYGLDNHSFVFDDLDKTAALDTLNQKFFSENNLEKNNFLHLPDSVQELYIQQLDHYIPNKEYKKQALTYIYLFTLDAMHFAITSCKESQINESNVDPDYQQQFMLYKVFSIQYTNDILRHIGSGYFHFDTKYENEDDLYEHIYTKILDLDANQLLQLAQSIYIQTKATMPKFDPNFYTTGTSFGTIGVFSCSKDNTSWQKYGSDFFGLNVSGVRILAHFKNRDVFSNTEGHKFKIINNTESHKD